MPRKTRSDLEAQARAVAADFDKLSDEQHVGIRVVAALRDRSICTVYRMIKEGSIPAPVTRCGKTSWRVGDLRDSR